MIQGKGAIEKKVKITDYRLEAVCGADKEDIPQYFSFLKNFMPAEHQNGSGSCVGQASAMYLTGINFLETGKKTKLSARDIYSLIHLPNGGAYIADAFKKAKKSGVAEEKDAPSYFNGNPPSEAFMRQRNDITEEEIEKGKTYLIKDYVTWDKSNFESYRRAIWKGKGAVSGSYGDDKSWANAIIKLPKNKDWGHCVLMTGIVKIDGEEYIEFLNSWGQWGNNGVGYMPKKYIEKGLTFNPITAIDLPNETYNKIKETQINMIEILKQLIKIWEYKIKGLKTKASSLWKTKI